MKNFLIGVLALILVIAIGYWLWGANTTDTEQSEAPELTDTIPATGDNQVDETSDVAEVIQIEVSGTNYAFDITEIRVSEGDTVRIVFRSEEGLHDLVIDEPYNLRTVQLNPGEEDTIEFIADQSGTFEYYCSVGRHRELGMVGTLIVE